MRTLSQITSEVKKKREKQVCHFFPVISEDYLGFWPARFGVLLIGSVFRRNYLFKKNNPQSLQ